MPRPSNYALIAETLALKAERAKDARTDFAKMLKPSFVARTGAKLLLNPITQQLAARANPGAFTDPAQTGAAAPRASEEQLAVSSQGQTPAEFLAALRGIIRAEEPEPVMTVEDALKQFVKYMRYERNLSPETIVDYTADVKLLGTFVTPPGEKPMNLAKIDHGVLREFVAFLYGK